MNLPPEVDGAGGTPTVGVGGATTAGHPPELQQLDGRDQKARVKVHLKVGQPPDDGNAIRGEQKVVIIPNISFTRINTPTAQLHFLKRISLLPRLYAQLFRLLRIP